MLPIRNCQQIHVHFGCKFFRLGDAHGAATLLGVVRTFDDVADFGFDADAERADQVIDLLRAADIIVQRFVGVINHHVREPGADGAWWTAASCRDPEQSPWEWSCRRRAFG